MPSQELAVVNVARNGVDLLGRTPDTPELATLVPRRCTKTRLAGGRGADGSEVLSLLELHGGRGT